MRFLQNVLSGAIESVYGLSIQHRVRAIRIPPIGPQMGSSSRPCTTPTRSLIKARSAAMQSSSRIMSAST
jgi:hypothetical protein